MTILPGLAAPRPFRAAPDILAGARRGRLRPALAAGMTVVLSAAGWVSTPFLRSASSQDAALGLQKMTAAAWHPERGDLLFVAVLGSDARTGPPNAPGGCDAIHIVAVNPARKAGTVLNFPRDAFLNGRKLTDTCRVAGFENAVGLLRSHTGIPIQYLVRTEFSNFMRLVDALGGMEVDVPYPMRDAASGSNFSPGTRHMFGGDVLSFVRDRHSARGGDFGRTENQGSVIISALKKIRKEPFDAHTILDYLRAGRRHAAFDVPLPEIVKMGYLAREIDPAAVQNITVPGSVGTAGRASVVYLSPGDTYDRVRDDAVW